MRRRQVFTRAVGADGKWESVDVFDLDDESFRAFILNALLKAGIVAGLRDEYSEEPIILRERKDE